MRLQTASSMHQLRLSLHLELPALCINQSGFLLRNYECARFSQLNGLDKFHHMLPVSFLSALNPPPCTDFIAIRRPYFLTTLSSPFQWLLWVDLGTQILVLLLIHASCRLWLCKQLSLPHMRQISCNKGTASGRSHLTPKCSNWLKVTRWSFAGFCDTWCPMLPCKFLTRFQFEYRINLEILYSLWGTELTWFYQWQLRQASKFWILS